MLITMTMILMIVIMITMTMMTTMMMITHAGRSDGGLVTQESLAPDHRNRLAAACLGSPGAIAPGPGCANTGPTTASSPSVASERASKAASGRWGTIMYAFD
jgi:hypothetical protein